MRATNLLLTVLAVASVAAAGCGDDPPANTTDSSSNPDGTDATTTDPTETTGSVTDTSPDGDTTNVCQNRECGTVAGVPCGTCDPGFTCSSAGQCLEPGKPLGAFCGITATCNPTSLSYPDCLDEQCASQTCLSLNPATVFRDVCTANCQIYQDNDGNGVNDADAPQDDCNPSDVVDGPAGNLFRCVNTSAPGSSPVGVCVPGSEFDECDSNADCPDNEACELTGLGGAINFRCVAEYRENASWGAAVVGLAQECNDNPDAGPVQYCESGLCFGLGCVQKCDADSDCDTTAIFPNTGCDTAAGTCRGNAEKACAADIDCSGWECGPSRQIFSNVTQEFGPLCWPKGCEIDTDCGGGFYCRFFWNGEGGDDAALDNSCLVQTPDGADLGEACDPDPEDNVPGDTCKNTDLCVGSFCSRLCGEDADCNTAAGQVCAVAELPGDEDEDGEDDFVLPLEWCQTYPGFTDDCRFESDCDAGESCQVYEVANPDTANASDAPFLLAGKCVPHTFQGEDGTFGDTCENGDQCRSGFCLGATETQPGFCTKVCSASTECGTVDLGGGETANGICQSLLYGYGGDIDDATNVVYLPLCVLTLDSLEDCSGDFECGLDNEICIFNTVSTDAAHEPNVEYLCAVLVEEGDPLPEGEAGDACDPTPAEDDEPECADGYCIEGASPEPGDVGYCTRPCDGDNGCPDGLVCTQSTVFARAGFYADNSGEVGLCRKPARCEACYGDFNCTGGTTCVNLGSTNVPDFRCVESCETAGTDSAECSEGTDCTASTDERGTATLGCFDKTGTTPNNFCD